jgi:hypothetical protein
METNTLRTNKYGAKMVSCDRHAEAMMANFFGTVSSEPTDLQCPRCRDEEQVRLAPTRMLEALLRHDFSHTRARYGSVYAYRYDRTSPSGFMLLAGIDADLYPAIAQKAVEAGASRGGCSPLSPTEAR